MTQIPQYRPADSTIAQLLMRRGDIAARGAERSGEIWGNAVSQLGQIVGGAVAQRQQEKEAEKRKALFTEALDSFDPADPGASYRKIAVAVGPEVANEVVRGFAAIEDIRAKGTLEPKDADQLIRAAKITKDLVGDGEFALKHYPKLQAALGPTIGSQMPPPEQVGQFLDQWTAPKPTETRLQPLLTNQGFQPFDPTKGTLGDVIGQPPTPKPEKSLADLEAEAAARARGTRAGAPPEVPKGTWTQAEDESGNPVLLNSATGQVKPYPKGVLPKPGATEANRIAASDAALTVSGNVRDFITKNKQAIGSIMGRYNSILQAVGEGDPIATKLMGELKSYSALQPQIHGFRNVQFVNQIEDLINIKQSPETLLAAIEGIDSAAKAVMSRGRSRKEENEGWTEIPGGRIREKK